MLDDFKSSNIIEAHDSSDRGKFFLSPSVSCVSFALHKKLGSATVQGCFGGQCKSYINSQQKHVTSTEALLITFFLLSASLSESKMAS